MCWLPLPWLHSNLFHPLGAGVAHGAHYMLGTRCSILGSTPEPRNVLSVHQATNLGQAVPIYCPGTLALGPSVPLQQDNLLYCAQHVRDPDMVQPDQLQLRGNKDFTQDKCKGTLSNVNQRYSALGSLSTWLLSLVLHLWVLPCPWQDLLFRCKCSEEWTSKPSWEREEETAGRIYCSILLQRLAPEAFCHCLWSIQVRSRCFVILSQTWKSSPLSRIYSCNVLVLHCNVQHNAKLVKHSTIELLGSRK